MKRIAMIALVLMMLLAATPAMAAKGGRPSPQRNFDVALSGVLDTDSCGTIPMTGTVPGTLRAGLSTNVAVGMNLSIAWSRSQDENGDYYDAGWGATADAFSGCHGISDSALATDSFGGMLIIDVDSDGNITSVLMLLDYFWRFGFDYTKRNPRPVQEVLEMFDLTASGLVDGTGTFTVTLFTKEGKDIINGWIPVGSTEGTLTATITPAG